MTIRKENKVMELVMVIIIGLLLLMKEYITAIFITSSVLISLLVSTTSLLRDIRNELQSAIKRLDIIDDTSERLRNDIANKK